MTTQQGTDDFPDWDPADPDIERVYYDLSDWSIDQQAAVSAAFADRGVPHTWEGFEVVVPQFAEAVADDLLEQLEARFGLHDDVGAPPAELGPDDPATEYDLGEWTEAQRATLVRAVTDAGVPLRIEDHLLLVPVAAETVVDELLDAIESGDVMLIDDDDDGDGPALGLTELFTMADRLRREPGDQRGRTLLEVAVLLDPERPPYGVALATWRRAVDACRRLRDALGTDEITAVQVADELCGLVRPFA